VTCDLRAAGRWFFRIRRDRSGISNRVVMRRGEQIFCASAMDEHRRTPDVGAIIWSTPRAPRVVYGTRSWKYSEMVRVASCGPAREERQDAVADNRSAGTSKEEQEIGLPGYSP